MSAIIKDMQYETVIIISISSHKSSYFVVSGVYPLFRVIAGQNKEMSPDMNDLCKIIIKHNEDLQFKLASFMTMHTLSTEVSTEAKVQPGSLEFEKEYQRLFDQWRQNFRLK